MTIIPPLWGVYSLGERRDIVANRNNVKSEYNIQKGIPEHIAIIMDGNGRWAKKRLLPRTMGHWEGMKSLKTVVVTCIEYDISVLTVFAFSTENWRRPRNEVNFLMDLLIEFLHKELLELHKNDICIKFLGDYRSLPQNCINEIDHAINLTSKNKKMIFNIALNYGGRDEIIQAVQEIGQEVLEGKIQVNEITEDVLSSHLYTKEVVDPDLLIRTAGEMRLSNFLLWQIAYTELWITDVAWPDFTKNHLIQAITDYQKRDRRFGGLSQD